MTPHHNSPTLHALRAARGAGRRRRMVGAPAGTVIGYLRVSGKEQAVTGLGLVAQEAAIRAECEYRGWTLVALYRDEAVSGRVSPDKRPGLADAIAALDRGEASVLMVAKVDRLARSLKDLKLLAEFGGRAGWEIVALNAPFDTTTGQGKMMVDMLGAFAELEAAMASDRMRAAMAVRKARGDRLGRPSGVSTEARARIAELRSTGLSWPKVADAMNAEGWKTTQGGKWHPATCQRLCP